MTMPKLIELMENNIAKIATTLNVSNETVSSWIDNPVLILDFGIIEAAKLSYAIDVDLIVFIETLEDVFLSEAWQ